MSLNKDTQKEYNDVEATLNRLQGHKGVQGIIITSHEGTVIRSSLDNIQTQQYSTLVTQLAIKGKSVVRDLDPGFCLFINYGRGRFNLFADSEQEE
jgi:predicted regulator of Ras-like GTPase activity (Roadblock/LC7/MglB family)